MLDPRQIGIAAEVPTAPVEADLEQGVAVKQFSFRELTYRRFMNHPIAKWAVLGLGLIVLACYGAPLWHLVFPGFIQTPTQYSILDAGQGPSIHHIFGTDSYLGHDIFSLMLYGGQLSLIIGIGSMIVAIIIAVIWGSVAGFFGG